MPTQSPAVNNPIYDTKLIMSRGMPSLLISLSHSIPLSFTRQLSFNYPAHSLLTPLESLKRIAAWWGSNVPSGLNPRVAPKEARRLFSSSADARRMCAPERITKEMPLAHSFIHSFIFCKSIHKLSKLKEGREINETEWQVILPIK